MNVVYSVQTRQNNTNDYPNLTIILFVVRPTIERKGECLKPNSLESFLQQIYLPRIDIGSNVDIV